MQALKIRFTAPSAHYRIPHSNNPHCTYPVPPYSTVIGLLANMLGDGEAIETFLDAEFALGIHSAFGTLTQEYVWYRNISEAAHKGRYISGNQRMWQERPDHMGGQSPLTVEVLNEVRLTVYLIHHNPEVTDALLQTATTPDNWLSHLHLGRAEDWAVLDVIEVVDLLVSNQSKHLKNTRQYYQWLPDKEYAWGIEQLTGYEKFFHQRKEVLNLVASRYRLVSPATGQPIKNRAAAIRNFNYIRAKLVCGPLSFIDATHLPELFVDPAEACPVYLTRIGKG